MAAHLKSHVLRREEKGLFGVPFKRLLLAGCGGGLAYTLVTLLLPNLSIPLAVVTTLLTLILTAPRGGIPRWQLLVYRVRGGLILAAHQSPGSLLARLAELLELPTDCLLVDGEQLFAPPQAHQAVDLREWIIYADARDPDGLTFIDTPLEAS